MNAQTVCDFYRHGEVKSLDARLCSAGSLVEMPFGTAGLLHLRGISGLNVEQLGLVEHRFPGEY